MTNKSETTISGIPNISYLFLFTGDFSLVGEVTRWTEYVVLVSGPSVYRASMAFDSKGFSAGDRRNPMQGGIARPSSVPRCLSQVV